MLLFTSPTSRVTVAYFLATFVLLLVGLASLHNHGDLAAIGMSDAQRSNESSARSVAQDNAEFSWDMVRIRVDFLFNRT